MIGKLETHPATQQDELREIGRRRRKLYQMGYEHALMGAPPHQVVGVLWPTYSQGYADAAADRQRIMKGAS